MTSNEAPPARPGLLRRLAAIFYDSLLLLAVLFAVTAVVLPVTDGEAIAPGNPFYTAYLVLASYLYFAWCWTHGGQTLGMRTWRIRVQAARGGDPTWRQSAARFSAALISWAACGAGFLWIALDPESRSWHDRWSGTVVVEARQGGRDA